MLCSRPASPEPRASSLRSARLRPSHHPSLPCSASSPGPPTHNVPSSAPHHSQLTDADIASLPVPQLQTGGGFLFIWVINYKYKWTLDLFEKWGYKWVRRESKEEGGLGR